jgi:hypothetical protein
MDLLTNGGNVYHAQKAIMNPNHEKKNTRPYMFMGFRAGTDLAFRFTGLTSGAPYRSDNLMLTPMLSFVDIRAMSCGGSQGDLADLAAYRCRLLV